MLQAKTRILFRISFGNNYVSSAALVTLQLFIFILNMISGVLINSIPHLKEAINNGRNVVTERITLFAPTVYGLVMYGFHQKVRK